MTELPPFAQALLQRRSAPSSPFSRTMNSPLRIAPVLDDPSDKNSEITALERRISELMTENRELGQLKKQLESERERTSALGREYDLLATSYAEEEDKLRATNEQIEQIRSLLDSKETIIAAKSAAIDSLQREYLTLQGEYRRALDDFEDQAAGVKTYRPQPLSPRQSPRMSPPPRVFDDFPAPRDEVFASPVGRDDFFAPRQDEFDYGRPATPPPREFEVPVGVDRTPKYDFGVHRGAEPEPKPWLTSPVELRMFTRPVTSSPVHAALRDNISFGDDPKPAVEDAMPTDGMTAEEMKKRLEELQLQKDRLEAILNRSPPKNVPLAEARREQQQTQQEFDFVVQSINKLRLEMRRTKAL